MITVVRLGEGGGQEEGHYLKVYISLIYRFNADKKRHLQSNDHNVIQLPPFAVKYGSLGISQMIIIVYCFIFCECLLHK